mmetsp:Transcript_24247/g.67904  ORF Transcript_24247/g.67904 Transcript_24247/m.67904 type:complete len:266 (-) Transcript_24247:1963-2760(-)
MLGGAVRTAGVPVTNIVALQTRLGERIPLPRLDSHGINVVVFASGLQVATVGLTVQTGPPASSFLDHLVVVRLHHIPELIEDGGAVHVERCETDTKQLHDLASEVLVREHGLTPALEHVVGGTGAHIRQHLAHHGGIGNVLKQVPVLPERVLNAVVQVVDPRLCILLLTVQVHRADGEELEQGEAHPLAELVHIICHGNVDKFCKPLVLEQAIRVVVLVVDGDLEEVIFQRRPVVVHLAWRAAHDHPGPRRRDGGVKVLRNSGYA